MDGARGRIRARADCHLQAARGDTLVPQGQRRADALALIADSGVRSYPSWIADLRGKSPTGIDRGHYAYQHLGSGEALELVREPANRSDHHAVAYCHHGVHLGYVPKQQRWIAEALDDGLFLTAVAKDVKISWIFRKPASADLSFRFFDIKNLYIGDPNTVQQLDKYNT